MDNPNTARIHITKAGRVLKYNYEMSISKSVTGLKIAFTSDEYFRLSSANPFARVLSARQEMAS